MEVKDRELTQLLNCHPNTTRTYLSNFMVNKYVKETLHNGWTVTLDGVKALRELFIIRHRYEYTKLLTKFIERIENEN